MYDYLIIDVLWLFMATLVFILSILFHKTPDAKALLVTCVALFVLTAVFDNVLIHYHVFSYNHARLLGFFVGSAPIEDFAYPLAGILIVPSLWRLLDHDKH